MSFQNINNGSISDIKNVNVSKSWTGIKSVRVQLWKQQTSYSFALFWEIKSCFYLIFTNVKNANFSIQTSWGYILFSNNDLFDIGFMICNRSKCFPCLILRNEHFSFRISSNNTFIDHSHTNNRVFMKFHSFLILNSPDVFTCFRVPHLKCAIFRTRNNSLAIGCKIGTSYLCSVTCKSCKLTILNIPHPHKGVFWCCNNEISFSMPMSKIYVVLNIINCSYKFEPLATHKDLPRILRKLELVYLNWVSHPCC